MSATIYVETPLPSWKFQMKIRILIPTLFLPFVCFLSASACVQDEPTFHLPTDASVWLNSPPLTSEMLAGKSAFLYFFEEG